MKKYLPLLVIAAVFPACCISNNAKHPETKLTLPEQLEDKTVALVKWVAPDEDGEYQEATADAEGAKLIPSCAGVWISADTFLTAEHCVDDLGKPDEYKALEALKEMFPEAHLPQIKPWDPTGQVTTYSAWGDIADTAKVHIRTVRSAKVLSVDIDHDLALVKATTATKDEKLPQHGVATLANTARVGDDIHIVGHTQGMWWTYMHGWIGQIRPQILNTHELPVDALQVSAPVWFGNSGGGVFNADGQLLGIMSWIKKVPNMGFAVRYDQITAFLKASGIH